MRRSLGPCYWARPPEPPKEQRPVSSGLPASGRRASPWSTQGSPQTPSGREAVQQPLAAARVKPYTRGSLAKALSLAKADPNGCSERILSRARADNAEGPISSREKTWEEIALAAGFTEPFLVTPEMIFLVWVHWTEQAIDRPSSILMLPGRSTSPLVTSGPSNSPLPRKKATRACKRGRGPAKEAQPLLLAKLPEASQQKAPAHPQGPQFPVRSTLVISWWLLREIEASSAEISHISEDTENQLIHWRLPSSKADWQALGATRSHSCCCIDGMVDHKCPYHALSAQLEFASSFKNPRWLFPTWEGLQPTKIGWVATFEWLAQQLGEPLETPTGARRFTGHSARATGAVHLASTQVELWRIQLFGRWGSEAFKLYVRNAPLSQLHLLAQESSVQTAISKAKAELAAMVKQLESLGQWQASQRMAEQPIQCLLDCESAAPIVPAHESAEALFVMNRRRSGKLHRVTHYGGTAQHYLWHSACFWYFARHDANYALLKAEPETLPSVPNASAHPKPPVRTILRTRSHPALRKWADQLADDSERGGFASTDLLPKAPSCGLRPIWPTD